MTRSTEKEGLTDKEFQILHGFLTSEHALAYPAMIERNSKRVTRVWAGKICADLKERGILDFRKIKPPRQKHKTEHYFLKRDIDAFLKLTKLIFEHKPDYSLHFMSSPFVQKQIDKSLVEELIKRKKIDSKNNIKEKVQYILPLLKISSSSLLEFLFGDWKPPTEENLKEKDVVLMDRLLFRLMLMTIGDTVKLNRKIPYNAIATSAYPYKDRSLRVGTVWVRQGNPKNKKLKDSLLAIKVKDGPILYYDGGFDTTHWNSNGFPVEEKSNPEDCRISCWSESRKEALAESANKWREKRPEKPEYSKTTLPRYRG